MAFTIQSEELGSKINLLSCGVRFLSLPIVADKVAALSPHEYLNIHTDIESFYVGKEVFHRKFQLNSEDQEERIQEIFTKAKDGVISLSDLDPVITVYHEKITEITKLISYKNFLIEHPIEQYHDRLDLLLEPFYCDTEVMKETLEKLNRFDIRDLLRKLPAKMQDDYDFVLAAVKKDGPSIQYASERLKELFPIALAAVYSGSGLEHLSIEMRSKLQIARAAVFRGGAQIRFLPDAIKRNPKILYAALKQSVEAYCFLPDDLKNDREIAKIVISKNGSYLKHLPEVFKRNDELIELAIKTFPQAIEMVPREHPRYRDFAKLCVSISGMCLQSLGSELQDDDEIVLIALNSKSNGEYTYVLQYASPRLMRDKAIVLSAVSYSGCSLQFAAKELCADKDICIAAVGQNRSAIQYCNRRLFSDKEFIYRYISKSSSTGTGILAVGACRFSLSPTLAVDKEFIRSIIPLHRTYLQLADPTLRDDKELILEAVSLGASLEFASDRLKNDPEVVTLAVQISGENLSFAGEEFRDRKDLAKIAISKSPFVYRAISSRLKGDEELIIMALEQTGYLYESLPEEFKTERFLKIAFAKNPEAFKSSKDKELIQSFYKDREFLLKLTENSLQNFFTIPKELVDAELKEFAYLCHLSSDLIPKEETEKAEFFKSICKRIVVLDGESDTLIQDLQKKLPSMLVKYKNREIHEYILRLLVLISKGDGIKRLHDLMKIMTKESLHIGRIFPLIMIRSFDFDPVIESALFEKVYRAKELKNGPNLQAFTYLIQELKQSKLSKERTYEILHACLSLRSKEERSDSIRVITAACAIDPTILTTCDHFDLEKIINQLIEELSKIDCIDSSIIDLKRKFNQIVLSKENRNHSALFIYAKMHMKNLEMKTLIKNFITDLLEGQYEVRRKERNSHASFLTAEQLEKWETPIFYSEKVMDEKSVSIDVSTYLTQKIEHDGHGGELVRRDLFLNPTEPQAGAACGGAGAPIKRRLNEIETLVLELSQASTQDKKIELIEELEEKIPDDCELKNDIRGLKKLLLQRDDDSFGIVDTVNVWDLFLRGTEVMGSCQRVDGNPSLTVCLLDALFDGKIRMLAIKAPDKKIKLRALIKLMIDEDDQPALFLERIYPLGTPEIKRQFVEAAKLKAKTMGIKLYEGEGETILSSYACASPFEYVDAGRKGVTSGWYDIAAQEITVD
jgi:hypothetical protein